jgi:hypothetical protein
MMNFLFFEGRFAWPAVAIAVYLTALLLLCDYVWRTSRMGGKTVLMITGLLGVLGTALLALLG